MNTRGFVRTALVLLFTAFCVVDIGGDLVFVRHPWMTYGFSAGTSGVVTAVDHVAAREGLHPGDRIAISALPPLQRWSISPTSFAVRNDPMTATLQSGRRVVLTVHPFQRTLADNVTDVADVIAFWICIVVAALLVLLRPSPATWSFYVFSYAYCLNGAAIDYVLSLPAFSALQAAMAALVGVAPAAFVSFAMRFPDAHPSGAARRFEQALLFVVGPLTAAWGGAAALLFTFHGVPLGLQGLDVASIVSLYAIGVAILLARYVNAEEAGRNRLRWIIAGFTLAYAPNVFVGSQLNVLKFFYPGYFPPLWLNNVAQAAIVFAPLAMAYTVLKHRLFDIRFVVSRALVFAVLTSMTVGLLALADWGFGRWLEQSRFALIAELGIALLLGIMLTSVHKRTEAFLNGVIFRSQTLALHALRRFAQETDLISDPKRLVSQTYDALRTRLESEYADIYTADGSAFALASAPADALPGLLPADDFAVLRLRRWGEPFECDEPEHPLRGALFVPMTARTQLIGFLVCGPKRDRTHYLPEEIETLSTLAHRAGSSYGWLTLRPAHEAMAPLPS